jgi:hypothetical protein
MYFEQNIPRRSARDFTGHTPLYSGGYAAKPNSNFGFEFTKTRAC